MSDDFPHQTNIGKTVNVAGDHTVVQVFDSPSPPTENIPHGASALLASLRERYQNRYEQKLDGRFEVTLKVSESFDSQDAQEFTERHTKDAEGGEAFAAINKAFEEQGRLLIVGNPGVGKTVLLLKLALNLLNQTNPSRQEAFPVIFNLASWSSYKYKNFKEWLIMSLVSGNGLSKDFAAELLEQGRVIFLLDGLDELGRNETEEDAQHIRARCLAALNNYLRRGRKAVVCCRREEFSQMRQRTGQDAPVSAKIEILNLTEVQIADALRHAQQDMESRAAANNLLKITATNKSFLEVLSTPFYFTTALEVFDKELWTEKDLPSEKAEIKKYLLNRFVETKLEHSPNPNNFRATKTITWLGWLAKTLDRDELVLFELANLKQEDIEKIGKSIYLVVGKSFFNNLLAISLIPVFSDWNGILGISIYLTVSNVVSAHAIKYSKFETEDAVSIDLTKLLDRRVRGEFGLVMSLAWVDGLLTGFLSGVLLLWRIYVAGSFGLIVKVIALSFIPVVIITSIIAGIFIWGFEGVKIIKEFAGIKHPYQRLRGGLLINLRFSVFIGVIFFIGWRLYESYLRSIYDYDEIGIILLILPLSLILSVFVSSPMYRHALIRLDLYRENKMPLKYATFLDYATSLRILEKDGGHWRFRHQNLQEQFAALYTSGSSDKPKRTITGLIKKIRLQSAKIFHRAFRWRQG